MEKKDTTNLQVNQIKSLSLYQLIGAPLQALVQAEAQAMQNTLEYIRLLGFENGEDHKTSSDNLQDEGKERNNFGKLRMVTFLQERRAADGTIYSSEISVPLISLIPIPILTVKNAEIEFSLKVADFAYEHDYNRKNPGVIESPDKEETTQTPGTFYLSPRRAAIKATMGSMGKVTENSSEYQIRVKMNVEQSDMPTGLSRLLGLANENIGSKRLDDQRPVRPGDE